MEAKFLSLARVTGFHGFSGKVKALSLTDVPEHLLKADKIWILRPREEPRSLKLEDASFTGKGFILKFSGLDSKETAGFLVGAELALPREGLPDLPAETFYVASLQGLRVVDEEGLDLGELAGVYPTGANDVYEIRPEGGPTYLIPATQEVVKKVDLEARRITVHLLPGLGPESGNA